MLSLTSVSQLNINRGGYGHPPPKETNMDDIRPARTVKESITFQLNFMVMMWNCGRAEEANKALASAMDLLNKLEEKVDA
jgi:hypothetical protein